MKKWTTTNGYEIFKVLAGRSNAYYVRYNGVGLLVDTGKALAYRRLKMNLNRLGLAETHTRILVLTHTHFDHCQNAFALANCFGFRIVMSNAEAGYARQGYTPLPRGTNLVTRVLSFVGNKYLSQFFGYVAFTPDLLLETGGELTSYGLDVVVIPTPGHSVGSISIVVDNEIALVGDALFGIFPNSAFPPFADDPDSMLHSWNVLLQTGCQLFLPGHGIPVSRELLQREFVRYK